MASSSLFALSAELRNCIYELVLMQAAPITITERSHGVADEMVLRSNSAVAHPTALLMVCKDIKAEASKMFYASQTFVFSCTNVNVTGAFAQQVAVAEAFLHQIGPHNILGLRSVRFEASTFCSFEYSHVDSPFTKLSALTKQNPQIKDFRCAAKLAMDGHRPNDVLEVIIDVCNLFKSMWNKGQAVKTRAGHALSFEPANFHEIWMKAHARLAGCAMVLVAARWNLREHLRKTGKPDIGEEEIERA
ncbi:hypothetical protein LTR56_012506 [Elasticomyces elasticus]|nr:hypothetical protein LTR56_012506 [Elasticomyces elasticus]KAK3666229.1 hypothetical protein LTR22_002893 [Elasticomyces elasticus]KAK4926826.1 hypothetical protein LTR49_006242 [Elasticomyces elasticus]KAK5763661.1 hypothetical protein LTS12_006218 [Elasticomyces elasticus]